MWLPPRRGSYKVEKYNKTKTEVEILHPPPKKRKKISDILLTSVTIRYGPTMSGQRDPSYDTLVNEVRWGREALLNITWQDMPPNGLGLPFLPINRYIFRRCFRHFFTFPTKSTKFSILSLELKQLMLKYSMLKLSQGSLFEKRCGVCDQSPSRTLSQRC